MRRRTFITLVGSAAVAWPLVARARDTSTSRRVGVLMNVTAGDAVGQSRLNAFQKAFQQLGWTDGGNVRIDVRWPGSDPERGRKYAAELTALTPDVLLASTTPLVAALQQATSTVPIVFVNVVDPVGSGMVVSLARPGGNVTGLIMFEYALAAKWLQLLKGDCTKRNAGGGSTRSNCRLWHWSVCGYSGRRIDRHGVNGNRHTGCRSDQSRCCVVRASRKRRVDCDSKSVRSKPYRYRCGGSGTTQTACRLCATVLRHGRWPHLLWA